MPRSFFGRRAASRAEPKRCSRARFTGGRLARLVCALFAWTLAGTVSAQKRRPEPVGDPFAEEVLRPPRDLEAIPFPLTLGKQTTVLSGPLRPDGQVDYLRYLNDQAARGATEQNNAAVSLVRALGPANLNPDQQQALLKSLGIESLADRGSFFIPLADYIHRRLEQSGRMGDGAEEMEKYRVQFEKSIFEPWSTLDAPALAGWLAANEAPIRVLREAAGRSQFFLPLLTEHPTETIRNAVPPVGFESAGWLWQMLLVNVNHSFGERDFALACDDLRALDRLSSGLAQTLDLATPMNYETSIVQLCEVERAAANSGKLSAAEIRKLRDLIARMPPVEVMTPRWRAYQRFLVLDTLVDDLRAGATIERAADSAEPCEFGPLLRAAGRWRTSSDEAARTLNQWCDRLERSESAAGVNPRAPKLAALAAQQKQLEGDLNSWRAAVQDLFGTPAVRARLLAAQRFEQTLLAPALVGARSAARARTLWQLTQIACALAAYRAEHGAFPRDLKALAPPDAAEPRGDLYHGTPFVYEPTVEGYRLYSMGENGRDDRGRDTWDEERQYQQDDISIEFPPPSSDLRPEATPDFSGGGFF
ncbi:MAG TPA: hypothetical protein VFE24_13050 [Pirellulales bacterium]|jgi:hypothetical protein|nr:hypothetical protein [Pirellulales bacterium]